MAELTETDLAKIRDEIGTTVPPSDDRLAGDFVELGSWVLVALRTLKRRRADLAAGQTSSLSIPGVVSVSTSTNVGALDRQIARLEAIATAAGDDVSAPGARSTRLRRRTARSAC